MNTEREALAARVREWIEEALGYTSAPTWSPSLTEEGKALLAALASKPDAAPAGKDADQAAGQENIWTVKIGGRMDGLPSGADAPMRRAVQDAYERVTGFEPEFTFSGWGGSLDEGERAVHENRPPTDVWLASSAAPAGLSELNAVHGYEDRRCVQGARTDAAGETDNLRGLDTPTRVRFYEHDFYPLSNFSAFTLVWKGIRFDTSEAAYHFEKFDEREGGIRWSIRTAESAHEAFKIAERNKESRRPDWDAVKVDVMRRILRAKAAQHEYVRRKVLATGDRELVEDSWRDDFWGWGPNRDGQNMLGRLWMEVRAELRAEKATSVSAGA